MYRDGHVFWFRLADHLGGVGGRLRGRHPRDSLGGWRLSYRGVGSWHGDHLGGGRDHRFW